MCTVLERLSFQACVNDRATPMMSYCHMKRIRTPPGVLKTGFHIYHANPAMQDMCTLKHKVVLIS